LAAVGPRSPVRRCIKDVRGDDSELASYMRIEERELEAGGLNQLTLVRWLAATRLSRTVIALGPDFLVDLVCAAQSVAHRVPMT
jgi:hypothetical protein